MGTKPRTPAQASIALTKKNLGYHLLRVLPEDYVSQPVVNRKRRKTPNIEDAPVSSSDDDSSSAKDVHINDAVSTSGWRQPQEYVNLRKENHDEVVAGKASTEIRHPTSKAYNNGQRRSSRGHGATTSSKRSRDVVEASADDNILDDFGQIRSSQGQPRAKKLRVYGPPAVNIHGSGSAGRAQYSTKRSIAGAKRKTEDADGFRIPNLEAMEEKLNKVDPDLPEGNFRDMVAKDAACSRSLRSSNRSAQTRPSVSQEPAVPGFKEPKLPAARQADDTSKFSEPVTTSGDDDIIRNMRGVTDAVLGKKANGFKMPVRAPCPTSSTTASTTLSSLGESGYSPPSSLSSPPASPILDASQEHHDFIATEIPDYYAPVAARCPMCKEKVDRASLEGFDRGKRMNVRAQTRFCRAHKQETARSQWRQRRYPDIAWTTFEDRLKRYRPNIKRILDGDVPSYYRNLLEHAVKGGRHRTLHQSLMSTGFHGLTPGYYGSRGARLMMDNIMTTFSSQIRRLAASDKIISSGGVSGYVQAVLVPELAVLLVKEDMRVDDEEARGILQESIEIGDLLNEEEEEVIDRKVVGDDSDDDVNDVHY